MLALPDPIGATLLLTIIFADGTPVEITGITRGLTPLQCANEATMLLLEPVIPIRDHPIKSWAIACVLANQYR